MLYVLETGTNLIYFDLTLLSLPYSISQIPSNLIMPLIHRPVKSRVSIMVLRP
jgi:hypothetical protein